MRSQQVIASGLCRLSRNLSEQMEHPVGEATMDARTQMEKIDCTVRYVPHEKIIDYMACYRVAYQGEEI